MGLFEKIKELVSSLKLVEKLEFKNLINISLFSNNKRDIFEIKGDNLNADFSKIKDNQENEIIKKIIQLCIDEEYTLIERKSKKVLEEIIDSHKKHKKTLTFLKDKLNQDDYKILRLAVYIKTKFDNHEDITDLRLQVIKKYGQRGSNICHLYSSGYFESFFIPAYIEMEKEDNFKIDEFHQFFDKVVMKQPFTIFVSRNMSEQQLDNEIAKKMKYGLKFVNIHGIGLDNVKKIKNFLEKVKNRDDISITETKDENSIIFVHLKFN